ncbi:DUF3450 family protein [Pelagicoccus mobilis]|uniref:DUF3450 family protein n=1 Tax=Pelagicoccus mobilis TaxID=415221 RepID=A0A934S2C9_9BACT|nr:DUF3450 family protein [Pelagicoccus mobilis]MBK1879915.1 DUF3450 family protein [Pelagicoccus mobilis]
MPKNIGSIPRRLQKLSFCVGLAAIPVWFAYANLPSDSVSKVEQDTDRWIELQSQISKARAEWRSEQTLLQSTIKLLETEESTLKGNLEANQKASDVYVGNRDRMKQSIDDKKAALDALVTPLARIETELRSLMPRLPEPLLAELKVHLDKIENGDGEIAIPVRVQSLVAALTAIDRFGNSLTAARITRPGPESGEVSVRVLYWGLACGYGVDEANQRAWVIQPGSGGWDWQQRDDLFLQISEMIGNYENESTDPQLISLPATLL